MNITVSDHEVAHLVKHLSASISMAEETESKYSQEPRNPKAALVACDMRDSAEIALRNLATMLGAKDKDALLGAVTRWERDVEAAKQQPGVTMYDVMMGDLQLPMLGDYIKEEETENRPPYDQETFEGMMDDYLSSEYPEEKANGEITIDRDSIKWNEDSSGRWTANCKFDGDAQWYTLVGYADGKVVLSY